MHVVATAGHVDHGKSTLVRALTGMEPDRWAEERRRGLTIDLGYAWTHLPGAGEVAFVDVPGHERFIANMLAGIGPAAAVLFVVAADAGWSRQSEEHLRAIDALGLRHGLLVVTRSDLADPAPALADSLTRIARSCLGEVASIAVSGTTGDGLDDLRVALARMLMTMPRPDAAADVRLWVDRSFSVRGSGTVVTATLSAGTVTHDDTFELGDRRVVVRGIESLGETRRSVTAPARVALNLRGVDRHDVRRGDALLTPDRWWRTELVDARLGTADEVSGQLVLHVGTTAVAVHVRPLAAGTARLSLASALPLRSGDRAVLRDPGRQQIVCGVEVLDADPPPLTRRGAARARGELLAEGTPSPVDEVERRGLASRAQLRRLGIPVPQSDLIATFGDWIVSARQLRFWTATAGDEVRAWASAHPLQPAMPLSALRQALGAPEQYELLTAIVTGARLTAGAGGVHRPGQQVSLAPGVADLVARLEAAPFAAPERDDLAALGLGRRELAAAEQAGVVVRVSADIVLLPAAIDDATRRLSALGPTFTTSQARQALDTTRRVMIPLLEHLDRLGRTERVDGTSRRITGN